MLVTSNNRTRQAGFALFTVLFVLLAVFVLCAPFLMTARNADQASGQLADRARARLALDAAGKHARAELSQSHPAFDQTFTYDDLEELDVSNAFDSDFLNANDARGVMWDVESSDVAGLIDINSASPHVLANLMGVATRFTTVAEKEAGALEVSSVDGFPDSGYLWSEGEFIYYESVEERSFGQLQRGLGAEQDGEDWESQGPQPPRRHGVGATVIGESAFGFVTWRIASETGEINVFDTPEGFAAAQNLTLGGAFPDEDTLRRYTTVYGGLRAGAQWQRPVRVTAPIQAGDTQQIAVDDARWFGIGSTVLITDGVTRELAYVQAVNPVGLAVTLDHKLTADYQPYLTEIYVLARRPVNLNTAPALVLQALFENVSLANNNKRVTDNEARELAALVMESRPLRNHQDFLERVLLPAAGIVALPEVGSAPPEAIAGGTGFIDPFDALALYLNGLNANDALLEFATMPYTFTSRDVYNLELRASVNAPSGVERLAMLRDRTELITPQRELFYLWARQADFDEALRLSRAAPYWATGPEPTSFFDGRTVPPSRRWAHFGTIEGAPAVPAQLVELDLASEDAPLVQRIFASEEDDGYLQLWPSRRSATPRWRGKIMHFDRETRDLEGRYLPDETIVMPVDDEMLDWVDPGNLGMMRAIDLSMWIKPTALGDATYFDVTGTSGELNRVQLITEGEDLVLRIFDAYGDHPTTAELEATEARFAIAAGDGPGIPLDTWTHVQFEVRGNAPDCVTMLVNGMAHGVRKMGQTRLASALPGGTSQIAVESTEGFPDRGVLRIGDELIEYVKDGDNRFIAQQDDDPRWIGFGGRSARTRFDTEGVPADFDQLILDHEEGTTVTHYGYSLPFESNLPAGGLELPEDIGPWRVARILRVETQDTPSDPITPVNSLFGPVGTGMEQSRFSTVTQLRLGLGDRLEEEGDENFDFMRTFNPRGGYAAIVQAEITVNGTDTTINNTRMGGVEIIRYGPVDAGDNLLTILERGDQTGLNFPAPGNLIGGSRAFIFQWLPGVSIGGGPFAGRSPSVVMERQAFIFPVSLPAPGMTAGTAASGTAPLLVPSPGRSELAQITHVDEANRTEWVRYDEIIGEQIVRSGQEAMVAVYNTLSHNIQLDLSQVDPDNPAPGGPNVQGADFNRVSAAAFEPEPEPLGPEPVQTLGGPNWSPIIGENDLDQFPLSRAVAMALRFRGVFGTAVQEHPAGTPLLPVFRSRDLGPDGGRPGRGDFIFTAGAELTDLGQPVEVHRAFRPFSEYNFTDWQQSLDGLVATDGDAGTLDEDGVYVSQIYVALQEPAPEQQPGNLRFDNVDDDTDRLVSNTAALDARVMTRMVKFPSGELPRLVTNAGIGTSAVTGSSAQIPSAVIDELAFGNATFSQADPVLAGGQLAVTNPFSESDTGFSVYSSGVLVAERLVGLNAAALGGIPDSGGLLAVGDEIMAYDGRDLASGVITLAVGGRGLLGTQPQPHGQNEAVTWLESIPCAILVAGVTANDSTLVLSDGTDFPREGTVLVGQELIHYTRKLDANTLDMPRASSEAGLRDSKGNALFRARFGTVASDHAAGTPVILFPFRYWDRWASQADAPELAYFEFEFDQPGAFWDSVFWESEPSASDGVRLGVLQRTAPSIPWDADPNTTEGLELMWDGTIDGKEIPIAAQADRVSWRAFCQYNPNAFDPQTGLAHGWKESPRFRRLGVTFYGPHRVLRSVDR